MKSRVFIGILSGVAIVLSIFAVCMNISEDIVVTNFSIVLGFIGVLATFIVVSNAVQLWRLEQQLNKCEVAIDEYKSKCDNSIKSNLELKDKIQIGLDTVQKAMSNNWNIMKHIVLTMVHKEYQYLNDNGEQVDKNKHLNLAFLYLIDIVPLLPHLYGNNGNGKDESGETLAVMMGLFQKIINKEKDDNVIRISCKNLKKSLKYFQMYFPCPYFELECVKSIMEEIHIRIKRYEMNN